MFAEVNLNYGVETQALGAAVNLRTSFLNQKKKYIYIYSFPKYCILSPIQSRIYYTVIVQQRTSRTAILRFLLERIKLCTYAFIFIRRRNATLVSRHANTRSPPCTYFFGTIFILFIFLCVKTSAISVFTPLRVKSTGPCELFKRRVVIIRDEKNE